MLYEVITRIRAYRPVRWMKTQEKSVVFALRPYCNPVDCYGFQRGIGYRKDNWAVVLPVRKRQFCFAKGDIIQSDQGNFLWTKPQAIGKMHHGIRPDLAVGTKVEAGKQFLYFVWA